MAHRLALVVALVSAGASPLSPAPQSSPSPQPNPSLVRVFVETDDIGEAHDLSERRESVRDLAAALARKKKTIAVVDDEDKADVVVEIVDRSVTVPKVVIGVGPPGQRPGLAWPTRVVVLRAKLTFGGDSVTFTNKNKPAENSPGWKSAADDIGDQVDKWIRDHRAEILRARGQ